MNIFDFVKTNEKFNYYRNNNDFLDSIIWYATDDADNKKQFLLDFSKELYNTVLKTKHGKNIKQEQAVALIGTYLGTTKKEIFKLINFYKKNKEQ